MDYLPAEIQLQIFKNLNYDELSKIKQVNRHFYNFINKYEDELARKRFGSLVFGFCDYYEEQIESIDFPLNKHLQEKWQSSLDKQIPVHLSLRNRMLDSSGKYVVLRFFQGENSKCFELRLLPQNIEELKIIRYWLKRIFKCVFDVISINNFIFNPEMIKVLFDSEEIVKLKLNCQKAYIHFNVHDIDIWNFTFDRLVISEHLMIVLNSCLITEEVNNILFKLLSNAGDRIPMVEFHGMNSPTTLYNLLINHIETATDLSKMVAKIKFNDLCSNLIVRGVKISESNDTKKCYKITNIHDPKMIFSSQCHFDEDELYVHKIEINRLY